MNLYGSHSFSAPCSDCNDPSNIRVELEVISEAYTRVSSPTWRVLPSSQELAILFSLPQRSVPGILVQERTPFGRSVVSTRGLSKQDDYIELGCISHLGRLESRNKVRLALSELTKHTFVTGSTGSGKSNTLYLMLEQLLDKGIKMLVIEPAKGEYKHVFGHRSDVRVLGGVIQRRPSYFVSILLSFLMISL